MKSKSSWPRQRALYWHCWFGSEPEKEGPPKRPKVKGEIDERQFPDAKMRTPLLRQRPCQIMVTF